MSTTDRRAFLETALAASALAALRPRTAAAAGPIKKAVELSMLPKELGLRERFQLARDVGFEGIEILTVSDPKEADEMKDASQKTGLVIHSVMNMEHWRSPLSSADPGGGRQERRRHGDLAAQREARGAPSMVLLVPAVVDPQTCYKDAWTRSQQVIKERILPLAAELKVIVGIEEVWNQFLLSPLEMARYVDELDSPWAKAYFDVGNVVLYGYPQDWIRTLGPRIVRVHLKDFSLDRGKGTSPGRTWARATSTGRPCARRFADIGFAGYMTTELAAGDAAYLKDVSARFDRFLAGEKPVAAGA